MIETFNIAAHLIGRNARRSGKMAFIDDHGTHSFGAIDSASARFAGYLRTLGLPIETRIMICMEDGVEFVTCVLGAIRAGIVPVMVNPLLTESDFAYLLDDSRAALLVVSPSALPSFECIRPERRFLRHMIVAGEGAAGHVRLADAVAAAEPSDEIAPTRRDEVCLWQYSSGSTGRPKGTLHTHGAVERLESLYPDQILRLTNRDVTFSAAKLFFGYGFGNGLIFPMLSGATAILMAERPTPEAVCRRLRDHQPTVFYGVPTLYASLLASPALPDRADMRLRLCTSAGEALPAEIGLRWAERCGVEILDGIGSTEMLHIFLSNRPGDPRYGTTGLPLDGVELRLVDDDGAAPAPGEMGELYIRGPTAAAGYWCNREKTMATFQGAWVHSGDKFRQNEDGRYVYCGRSDDMLKVSGIYVSPFEVESTLVSHEDVLEAAVVGRPDGDGLIKLKAFVVLRAGVAPCSEMAVTLQKHVKTSLAPYKYPRTIEFLTELPKTASGKVERYKLRAINGK